MKGTGILNFLLLVLLHITSIRANAAPFETALHHPQLTDSLYLRNGGQLFWFQKDRLAKRMALLELIGQSAYVGLDRGRYHYEQLKTAEGSVGDTIADRLFTDAAITFLKDLYQGYGITELLGTDQISGKYAVNDNRLVIERLSGVNTPGLLTAIATELQPSTAEYHLLKSELAMAIAAGNNKQVMQLSRAINFYRWIHHFRFRKYIVVNAGAAILKYYENDDKKLEMKVVVGKPSTRTPRFAAYCNEVILYPYWNVPNSIATKEILPKVKKDRAVLDAMDLHVINSAGAVVNPATINWQALSAANFPYRLRQSTGCDNALGVLKFNLTSPYAVYLHDTDVKTVFKSKRRYYSHGCIRVERPMDLANYLLPEHVDEKFLEACVKDQKPIVKQLKEPVPVFVIYSTVEVSDSVSYFPDTYNLEL